MELTTQYAGLVERIEKKQASEQEIEQFLSKAEQEFQKEQQKLLSFNHPLEAYYYEYYVSREAFKEVPVNMGMLYRTLAGMQLEGRKMRKAETSYNLAYRWNPTDLDTMYALIELNKKDEDLDRVYSLTEKCYPFCCTRADLAHYYRNLGFYYLESYEPMTAVALYEYSNLFYPTKQAENELAYLKSAMGEKYEELDVERMQQILAENEIPLQAARETVGIAYQVGVAALQEGQEGLGVDCLMMVYDVTRDEEVKALLQSSKVL